MILKSHSTSHFTQLYLLLSMVEQRQHYATDRGSPFSSQLPTSTSPLVSANNAHAWKTWEDH